MIAQVQPPAPPCDLTTAGKSWGTPRPARNSPPLAFLYGNRTMESLNSLVDSNYKGGSPDAGYWAATVADRIRRQGQQNAFQTPPESWFSEQLRQKLENFSRGTL